MRYLLRRIPSCAKRLPSRRWPSTMNPLSFSLPKYPSWSHLRIPTSWPTTIPTSPATKYGYLLRPPPFFLFSRSVTHNTVKVVMEFMGNGCLTEVLDQWEFCQMNEGQIAYVCREVSVSLSHIKKWIPKTHPHYSLNRPWRHLRSFTAYIESTETSRAITSCWMMREKSR